MSKSSDRISLSYAIAPFKQHAIARVFVLFKAMIDRRDRIQI
ncbi:MAG: hypothetical protein AB8B99_05565 [Phormidesmis sp.]